MAAPPTILIGLGATKAGTSWLFDQLAMHPECHFRTIKELHYFNTMNSGRWGAALRAVESRIARFTELQTLSPDRNADFRQRHLSDLRDWADVLRHKGRGQPHYAAYLAQGAQPGARLCGDVTPAYALLPEADLRSMATIGPDVRFVYLMREPVARLWSHVRMVAARQSSEADRNDTALALMRRLVTGGATPDPDRILDRGDYRGALMRMAAALDPRRLLVMFQETLMTVPGLAQLADFLGLRPIAADLNHRVHEGFSLRLPDDLARAARWMLRPQYDFVAAQRGPVPDAWHAAFAEGSV